MKINVGVLYGGASTEHEISIISAVQAMQNIDKEKYNVIPIYLSKDNKFYTSDNLKEMDVYKNLNNIGKIAQQVIFSKKENDVYLIKNKFPFSKVSLIDIVLPVVHGYNTEDGSIAGFLEVMGIPYCESDIYASVIGQDKVFQKQILDAVKVPIVKYDFFYDYEFNANQKDIIKRLEKNIGYPMIVKPARQGSSVGISISKDEKELIKSINDASIYDNKILVEEVVQNMSELNCSVLGYSGKYETGVIEEVFGKDEFLSFKDKYMSSSSSKGSKGMASTGRKVPADISAKMQKNIEEISILACKTLDTSGVVRIDYLLDKKNEKVYLNELNIVPGSLSFYLWTPKKVEYKELLNRIIDCGIKRFQDKKKKTTSFESNVLASFKGSKGVKK